VSTPSIKELRQARAREGRHSPKWLRLLYVAAGFFVVYVLTGFFIAPSIVRSQLEKRLSAELKREVHVAKVALNPLTLSGAIEGFAIREREGTQNFIAWKRAFANFDSWSLFAGEWRFDQVFLDGAEARVAVDRDGKLNFADILAQLQSRPADTSTEDPKPLRIRQLSVSSARLDYREDVGPEPFTTVVGPVTFALREFSTGGKNNAPGEFSATTESGETIGWRGALAVAPLRSSGDFSLGNIVLKKYMPYVARFANFAITDGTLAVKARYELVFIKDKPALRVQEGAVSLKTFKLGAPGAAEPAVALDSLEVTGLAADSNAQTASVARVALTGGRVELTRDAQGIDLLRLLQPKNLAGASASAPPPVAPGVSSTAQAPAFDAKLGELAVTGLALVVNDSTTPRPALQELTDVSLNIKDVSLAQLAKTSPLALSAKLAGGGALRVSGNLAPQPLKGALSIELENAPLSAVSPYAETFVNLRIAQGSVSTKARVTLDTPASGGMPVITAHADASIADFQAIEGNSSDELARWKTLTLRGVEAVTAPSLKLLVADIEWTDPVGRLVVGEDGGLNLADLLVAPAKASGAPAASSVSFNKAGASASAAEAPATSFIAVDRFLLNNAAFTFVDRSMEPDVKLSINQLGGTISGLSSATLARADVDLKGKVDGVAPVSIRGQINPLASEAFTDLKVDFRGIDLRPTGPYVSRYAGYQLERGALTLDVKAKLAQRRLDTSNVVTLDQFTLGQKTESPDATKLPVGLALALLRDRQGKIVLDVPVQGSLDDPEFRIGRVVMRVLGNILTKAATSPFSLLGSMFGGGSKSEELAFQEFVAGADELTEQSLRKLEVVAKALSERPALRLEIAGAYGAAVDTPALRERELEKGLRMALWDEQRKTAKHGEVVPPPEQITVSPEASARMIGVFYRAAFEPKDADTDADEAARKAGEDDASEPKKKRIWEPVVRMFRRGGAPAPAPAIRSPSVKTPQPRPFSSATAGTAAPEPGAAQAGDAPPGPTLEEMRAKLIAAITIDENTLRELAAERARRVRSYLIDEGHIEPERISLVGETNKGPRVDLQLK
jgi:uncharacterized protein involved in outer membrane biogenesis